MKGLLIHTNDWIVKYGKPPGKHVKNGLNDPHNKEQFDALKFWWKGCGVGKIHYDITNRTSEELGEMYVYPRFEGTGNILTHNFLKYLTTYGYRT